MFISDEAVSRSVAIVELYSKLASISSQAWIPQSPLPLVDGFSPLPPPFHKVFPRRQHCGQHLLTSPAPITSLVSVPLRRLNLLSPLAQISSPPLIISFMAPIPPLCLGQIWRFADMLFSACLITGLAPQAREILLLNYKIQFLCSSGPDSAPTSNPLLLPLPFVSTFFALHTLSLIAIIVTTAPCQASLSTSESLLSHKSRFLWFLTDTLAK